MQRGCVISIIAGSIVILAVSVLYYLFFWPDHQRQGTSQCLYVIEKAIDEYGADFEDLSAPPSDNGELAAALLGENPRNKEYIGKKTVVLREGKFVDFWKRELRFEEEDGVLRGSSAGPNGDFGDDDDITSQLARDLIELHHGKRKASDDSA